MNRHFTRAILVILLLPLVACSVPSAAEATAAQSSDDISAETSEPKKTEALPTPTAEPAQISPQPYTSQLDVFSINFPQGWNCSESGSFQTDCQSLQEDAAITVRVTGTGYELYQENFESLVHAEQVFQYGEKKAYIEQAQEVDEGYFAETATWREGERTWQSQDRFYRRGAAVYQLHFRAFPEKWAAYEVVFDAVSESAVFRPEKLSGQQIYATTREYTSPSLIFTLDVPTAWSRYVDGSILENAIWERFQSPDGRAAIEMIEFEQGQNIDLARKAFKALDIMRDLYGFEWRVSDDRAMPNDLERLEWYAPRFDLYGTTYFDTYKNFLYMFNIVWDEPTEMIYRPMLEEIAGSFRYK